MTKAVSVSVKDVTWSLPLNRKKILHPISFDLDPGKILGVVGPNGSGKSTLLRLLYRFYKPTSGLIKIDDTNIWAVSGTIIAFIFLIFATRSFWLHLQCRTIVHL